MRSAAFLAALLTAPAGTALAECRMAAAGNCQTVPEDKRTLLPLIDMDLPDAYSVGDRIPRGTYSILMDRAYYGLPPVADGWVYMHIGDEIFRVDWDSHEVLEKVTWRANDNFRK